MNVKPWPEHLHRRLYALKARGESVAYIAKMLNLKETQVRHRLRWDKITPEERAKRSQESMIRQRIYRARKKEKPRVREIVTKEKPIYRPTPEMLADRDRREAMPHRDLAGAFFGDPKLGMSALEGRR